MCPTSIYPYRHYSSSGESSPELPVLSKVRYRGASGQTRVKSPSSPTDSPYSGYNSAEEYDGSRNAYFDLEVINGWMDGRIDGWMDV